MDAVETHSPAEHQHLLAVYGVCTVCAAEEATVRILAREAHHERVVLAASPAWLAKARKTVIELAAEMPDGFTTDDVWERVPMVAEPRVLGTVLRALADDGRIIRSDETRISRRPANHARPVRVWTAAAARLALDT